MTTSSNSVTNDDDDGILHSAISSAEDAVGKFADSLGEAMTRTSKSSRTSDVKGDEVAVATLAEVGGLPPPDNEVLEKDVEVMSEEPEPIDTSRADLPPARFKGTVVCLHRATINLCFGALLALTIVSLSHIGTRMARPQACGLLDSASNFLHSNLSYITEGIGLPGCGHPVEVDNGTGGV